MTLEEFFNKNPAGSYSINCERKTKQGHPCFYIHSDGVSGDVVDYYVIGNQLYPLTSDLEKECSKWPG